MNPQDQIQASHAMRIRCHAEIPLSKDYHTRISAWFDERTTDYWDHDQMWRCLQPLLGSPQRWLS